MNLATAIFLLIALFNIISFLKAASPTSFEHPVLDLVNSIDFSQGATLNYDPYDVYEKVQISNFYISRKTSEGRLQIFDMATQALKLNIFSTQGYPSSNSIKLWTLPDDDNETLGVIFSNNITQIYVIGQNQTLTLSSQLSFSLVSLNGLKITNDDALLLGYNGTGTVILRFRKSLGFTEFDRVHTNLTVITTNIKSCKISSTEYRFAIWKGNCYVQAYHCVQGGCNSIYFTNNTACDFTTQYSATVGSPQSLAWNSACTQLMFQSKNEGLKIVNISNAPPTEALPITDVANLLDLQDYWFLDSYDKYVGAYFTNQTLAIYDISLSMARETTYTVNGILTSYNRFNKAFIHSSDSEPLLVSYFTCPNANFSDFSGALCVLQPAISPNITANSTTNSTTNTSSNISPNANTTNSTDSTENSTNLTNGMSNHSNTTNNANQSTQTNISRSKLRSVASIYSYQDSIGTAAVKSFSKISPVAQYTNSVFQILPFSYLFMSFINFWSICSFYLISGIIFPTYIRDILLSIYENINASLFESFGIYLSVKTGIQEKYGNQDAQIFGLKSDFYNANYEAMITLLFSYMILGILFVLSRKLPCNNCVRNQLNKINFKMAVIGQFISKMSTFFLNFSVFTRHSQQYNLVQKTNLILHHFFTVLSVFITCLAIIFIDKKTKNPEEKKQLKIERFQTLVNFFSNAIFPLLAASKNIQLFLGLNLIFFTLPVYLAFQQKSFKIPGIIQSLYIPIFHFGVIVMAFSNEDKLPSVFHHTGIFITVIVFLGAIHEILFVFFSILYALVSKMLEKCRKVENESTSAGSTEIKITSNQNTASMQETLKFDFVAKNDKITSSNFSQKNDLYIRPKSVEIIRRNRMKLMPKKAINLAEKFRKFAVTSKDIEQTKCIGRSRKIQLKNPKKNQDISPLKFGLSHKKQTQIYEIEVMRA